MPELSRREALAFGAATIAASAIPAAAIPAVEAVPSAPALAWSVGTPGEFDWQAIFAKTEDEARRMWVEDYAGLSCCEVEGQPDECDCDFCIHFHSAEVTRVKKWDGKTEVTPAEWLIAGMGHICSRCEEETAIEFGGHPVGKEAVCEDCMTLGDWDIVNPKRAAEIRADLADEIGADAAVQSTSKMEPK
jgi:hypothetical protein